MAVSTQFIPLFIASDYFCEGEKYSLTVIHNYVNNIHR